jgi:pyridoxal 5'-phosphate synthase pdxS subunit
MKRGPLEAKIGFAETLKGGVIIDVTTPEQARIAEDAGAAAIIASDRFSADIRVSGGIARMPNPEHITHIQEAVAIPTIVKCRIGHFVEAQIVENLGIDFIDESEVLTPADEKNHIDKRKFKVPFICGARDLGEALRRIGEGAAIIRTKGEAGSGNIVEAIKHMRDLQKQIHAITKMDHAELMQEAKRTGAPYHLLEKVANKGKFPLPLFGAGGIATPADAAMLMQLGAQGIFVGSSIFKSDEPLKLAKAMVQATTHFQDPQTMAKISIGVYDFMEGIDTALLSEQELLSLRGW